MKKILSVFEILGFYVLSFTWGIILTAIGCVVSIGLLLTAHRPHLFYQNIYFEVGKTWKGLNLGVFFITNKNSTFEDKQRLSGHGIQNIIFGVFTPLIITIPCVLRQLLMFFKTYEAKRIFAIILFLCAEVITMTLCIVGFYINIDLMHVMCCVVLYLIPLNLWFFAQELPRYQYENRYYLYEERFIERIGVKLGKKFYENDKLENKGEQERSNE